MPRAKGDGRQLYVRRKQRPPTERLTEDEWAEVVSHSKIGGSAPFPKALREDLNDAIDVPIRVDLESSDLQSKPARER